MQALCASPTYASGGAAGAAAGGCGAGGCGGCGGGEAPAPAASLLQSRAALATAEPTPPGLRDAALRDPSPRHSPPQRAVSALAASHGCGNGALSPIVVGRRASRDELQVTLTLTLDLTLALALTLALTLTLAPTLTLTLTLTPTPTLTPTLTLTLTLTPTPTLTLTLTLILTLALAQP